MESASNFDRRYALLELANEWTRDEKRSSVGSRLALTLTLASQVHLTSPPTSAQPRVLHLCQQPCRTKSKETSPSSAPDKLVRQNPSAEGGSCKP